MFKNINKQSEEEPVQKRKNNPFAKKKMTFGGKKHKFYIKKPDIEKGISQKKGEHSDSDSGGRQRHVARSALVKQHDSAILLNFKPKGKDHEKEESAGGKKKHVSRSALVKQHDASILLNYKPKGKASELAKQAWKNFPRELKEELRKTLPDSSGTGVPDAFR